MKIETIQNTYIEAEIVLADRRLKTGEKVQLRCVLDSRLGSVYLTENLTVDREKTTSNDTYCKWNYVLQDKYILPGTYDFEIVIVQDSGRVIPISSKKDNVLIIVPAERGECFLHKQPEEAEDDDENIAGINTSADLGEEEHLECVQRYVDEMNRVALNIGMSNSIFNTPSGLCRKPVNLTSANYSIYRNSYTTAYDLLRLLIAARHTPTVLKVMGTASYKFKKNDVTYTVNHSTINTEKYIEWARTNHYTILAAKGGSLTGGYGEIGYCGILNLAILIQDEHKDIYAVAVVGLQRPSNWFDNVTYAAGERVIYNEKNYVCTEDNENVIPGTNNIWLAEDLTEQDRMRQIIHDLIECLKGGGETTTIYEAANRVYPVGMAATKLTVDGTFAEDILNLDNGIYYNKDTVRVAASTTKILNAIVAVSMFNNHINSINFDDMTGGSGLDFMNGDKINTLDALYVMILSSDNSMATLFARTFGKQLAPLGVNLAYAKAIPHGTDVDTLTVFENYKCTILNDVNSLVNCPVKEEAFIMRVGSAAPGVFGYLFQEITTLNGVKYYRRSSPGEVYPQIVWGKFRRQTSIALGINPIEMLDNDNPQNWVDLGTGIAYFTEDGLLTNKPVKEGFLINLVQGNVVRHFLIAQTKTGTIYKRAGSVLTGWYDASWNSDAETGTDGIWTYRKSGNGMVEFWGTVTLESGFSINNEAQTGVFYSDLVTENLPFTCDSNVHATITGANIGFWATQSFESKASVSFRVCSNKEITTDNSVAFRIYAWCNREV